MSSDEMADRYRRRGLGEGDQAVTIDEAMERIAALEDALDETLTRLREQSLLILDVVGQAPRYDAALAGTAASEPCDVRSSITDQPCLLPKGHEPYKPTRFHRYEPRIGAAHPLTTDPSADGSGQEPVQCQWQAGCPNESTTVMEVKWGTATVVRDLCDDHAALMVETIAKAAR